MIKSYNIGAACITIHVFARCFVPVNHGSVVSINDTYHDKTIQNF